MVYHRVGKQEHTILLLHGLGDNGLCWSRTAQALAGDFTVIMLDSRGHGGSSMPPEDAIHDPAEDMRAVLDHLGVERTVVLGHSIGAIAACQFASAYGARIAALVLEDPTFRNESSTPSERMVAAYAKQIERFREMSSAEVMAEGRMQHPIWDVSEFEAWAEGKLQVNPAILKHFVFPGWRHLLERVEAPTLMIRGEPGSDRALAAVTAEAITACHPQIQSAVVENAGHNVRRENFAGFLRVVVDFLRRQGM